MRFEVEQLDVYRVNRGDAQFYLFLRWAKGTNARRDVRLFSAAWLAAGAVAYLNGCVRSGPALFKTDAMRPAYDCIAELAKRLPYRVAGKAKSI